MTETSDNEKELFRRAAAGDEAALKPVIERYLRLLFAFALTYAPYGREQAFRLTVSAFAAALREKSPDGPSGAFLESLFRHLIEGCARTQPAGTSGLEPFGELPAQKRASLSIVREALIHLAPREKSVLLLRDQCHLPFERIAPVLGLDARDARSACLAARERLRSSVKEILEKTEAGR